MRLIDLQIPICYTREALVVDNLNAYNLIHSWLNRHHKRLGICKFCGQNRKTQYALRHRFHYDRKIEHFVELCSSCHANYDMTDGKREKLKAVSQKERPNRRIPVSVSRGNSDMWIKYGSVSEAAQKLKVLESAISNCLKGRAKTSSGYKFKYTI